MTRVAAIVMLLAGVARAEHIDWFAFDIDLGGGATAPHGEGVWLSRGRLGYVAVRGKLLWSIGAAGEWKDSDFSLGVAGELVSVRTALAAHAAAMTTLDRARALELGAGWAGLRLEAQVAFGDRTSYAVLAFARLPLGAIAYKLWGE